MRMGIKSHYALLAMVDLALHEQKKPISLGDIATRQKLPLPYLEQLFNQLKRKGLVISARGQKGGYTLGQQAHLIRITNILEAVEQPLQMRRCSETTGSSCQGEKVHCRIHRLWEEIENTVDTYLRDKTLADLCGNAALQEQPCGIQA